MDTERTDVLPASEVELYTQALENIPLTEIGSKRWWVVHEYIEKLNMQAIIDISTNKDEFVKECLISYEKISTLIHDLLSTELWKEKVFPLVFLDDNVNFKSTLPVYMVLFHEVCVAGLLQTVMYHQETCEVAGEAILDLVDYCYRKIYQLLLRLKDNCGLEEVEDSSQSSCYEELKGQDNDIQHTITMKCLSVLQYIADAIECIPISALTRILNTHDIPCLLVQVLEMEPWYRETKTGKREEYLDGKWKDVSSGGVRLVSKVEGQVWLCLYQLLMHPDAQRKYEYNSYRKGQILKLRRYMTEVFLDQLPHLSEMHRFLEHLAVMDPPAPKQELILEQIPEVRSHLESKYAGMWESIAEKQQQYFILNDQQTRDHAQRWAATYNLDLLERLVDDVPVCAMCKGEAMKRCSRCTNEWYCSRPCQVQHWKKHKPLCDLIAGDPKLKT